MRFNPTAIIFWAFFAIIGYFVGPLLGADTAIDGALVVLGVGLGLSLIMIFLN